MGVEAVARRGQGGAWRRRRGQVGATTLRRHAHFGMECLSVQTLRPYHYHKKNEMTIMPSSLSLSSCFFFFLIHSAIHVSPSPRLPRALALALGGCMLVHPNDPRVSMAVLAPLHPNNQSTISGTRAPYAVIPPRVGD